MISDAELLQRYAREGAQDAFAELVQRHLPLVYSTALRRVGGDTHLAEDVAQIVFTDFARKARTLTGRTTLAGWFYLGAHHAAAQSVRAERRRQTREQEAHAMEELFASSHPPADWERVRPVLDDALRELNEADREAVLLRFFQQRPFAAIGAALNLSEDAARMRVERALDKLHALLAKRGVTSTAAALGIALGGHAAIAAPAGLAAAVTAGALASTAALGVGGVIAASGILMSKYVFGATAVAILGLGFGAYHYTQARRAEAEAVIVVRERDSLATQLRAERNRPAALPPTAKATESPQSEVANRETAALTASSDELARENAAKKAALDRALAAADLARMMQSLDLHYRPLYRAANFNPAQIEQFKRLLEKNAQRQDELYRAVSSRNSRGSLSMAAHEQLAAEFAVDARELFGDALLPKIERFNETQSLRAITVQLANQLFYTDAPLSPHQAEQLVEIFATHARSVSGQIDVTTLDLEAALQAAQGVLTPVQLAELRDIAQLHATRKRQQRELEEKSAANAVTGKRRE